MKPVFKDDQAVTRMQDWFERFRTNIGVPTESRTVATRFGDTHVLVGGPPSAPPLVAVHGAMATSAHMLRELAPLLSRYRIYAIDVIGQSVKTPHARPPVNNNDYGIWLGEVLDGLELPRVSLLAVSWGGFAATRLAVQSPERIERLALLVPAGIVNGHAWQGIKKLAWPMMMNRLFPSEKRFFAFAKNLLTTTDDEWLPYLRDAFASYNMDMRVPKLATPEELAAFKAPVLVIAGDQDISFPGDKLITRVKQLFPSLASAELIPDCKHCPPTTDEFRAWLTTKLDGFFSARSSTAAAS